MGANLWGGSPLSEYRLGLSMRVRQPRTEGKGETARDGPKEAGVQEVRGDGLQTA